MPKIFRTMRKGPDDKPTIGTTSNCLGVRVPKDVVVDEGGVVELNGGGMSVSPSLRSLPHFLLPKRLNGTASDSLFCFSMGKGPFIASAVSEGLALVLDRPSHGLVVPEGPEVALLTRYQANLAATRDQWTIDED